LTTLEYLDLTEKPERKPSSTVVESILLKAFMKIMNRKGD
jgi:hypothetical protein